ncbi:unnamed protein product, partial [Symbiodinium sp. KB8]
SHLLHGCPGVQQPRLQFAFGPDRLQLRLGQGLALKLDRHHCHGDFAHKCHGVRNPSRKFVWRDVGHLRGGSPPVRMRGCRLLHDSSKLGVAGLCRPLDAHGQEQRWSWPSSGRGLHRSGRRDGQPAAVHGPKRSWHGAFSPRRRFQHQRELGTRRSSSR